MLLTSSQVSVAVSSGIVILCTAALFLSGYVLQQRTLRELREAIKPAAQPSPKIFLPDRFKQSTTELEDGSIVLVDEGNDGEESTEEPTIEVKPTLPDNGNGQKPLSGEQHKSPDRNDAGDNPGVWTSEIPTKMPKSKSKGGSKGTLQDSAEQGAQKPMSRAERRRRIKEEIMRSAPKEGGMYYRRRMW